MKRNRSVRAALATALRRYRGLLLLGVMLGVLAVQLVQRTTGFARPDALVSLLCVAMLVLLLGQDAPGVTARGCGLRPDRCWSGWANRR